MSRPNILFLMTDQMQGRVLDPAHPCQTPHFDRLAARGVRFPNAYTPNPVCSPARASLMTGVLPSRHGVITVNHCVHDELANLDESFVHWAQRLQTDGYQTGYFGKWHIERTNELNRFGWAVDARSGSAEFARRTAPHRVPANEPTVYAERLLSHPGWQSHRLYAVIDTPPEQRGVGLTSAAAGDWLAEALAGDEPWCCFVSVSEPHDPFVCSKPFFDRYDPASLPVPANWTDDLAGRPGLYRKSARIFADLTEAEKRTAAACYYALISEIDHCFGKLLNQLEASGQADDTIVVLTSDHGEFLGAHGMYMKNVGAWEEAYQIPLVVAGPGMAAGAVSPARVGLHDLAPTLLELTGCEPIEEPECRSLVPVLREPITAAGDFTTGYAEYYGTRHWFSQRVIWSGDWKLVWNGFDFDELYHLADDPGELRNLADDPAYRDQLVALMRQAYQMIEATDDHPLGKCQAASLRLAEVGPGILNG